MEDYSCLEPDEIQAKIDEAQSDPYYFSDKPPGDLMPNMARHKATVEKVQKMFEAKHPEEKEQVFDDDGNDITPAQPDDPETVKWKVQALDEHKATSEAAKQKLDDELQAEIELLRKDAPDDFDFSYDEATPELIEKCKSLRLLCDGDIQKAGKQIIASAEAAAALYPERIVESRQRIAALQMFIDTLHPDDEAGLSFLADMVDKIYQQRRKGVNND